MEVSGTSTTFTETFRTVGLLGSTGGSWKCRLLPVTLLRSHVSSVTVLGTPDVGCPGSKQRVTMVRSGRCCPHGYGGLQTLHPVGSTERENEGRWR